jgi:putative N6-adenine-specific DNA methylase
MDEFVYQHSERYFAQVAGGMEEMAADELCRLGAEEPSLAYRGLYFNAGKAALYRINYQSRLINRVLAPLFIFKCHSAKYLYIQASKISWPALFTPENTFAVFASVSHSHIRHSKYAAQKLKDAIVDTFRRQTGKRPDVERHTPDVWINLYIINNRATISLDTSGGSLHRRGYRVKSVEAPMQETLAAAILLLSEWTGDTPLHDPMCGSGTLLAEALMICSQTPAAFFRKQFGFEYLPDFDPSLWGRIRKEAERQQKICPQGLISGSDHSSAAVKASRQNLSILPGGERIGIQAADFEDVTLNDNTTIVCNPPYGLRMGNRSNTIELYKRFGDYLKQRCKGCRAFIYFGDRSLLSGIGLKPSWKKPLVNGALDGRLAKFEIY